MEWNPAWANAIASIESQGSGGYSAVGPQTAKGDRAYGKYQVMDFNIPTWTQKHLGQKLTPEQFLASPESQDAVFRGEFGSSVQKYGNPQDAASVWFTGRPASQGAGRSDILGTTGSKYVNKFNSALGQASTQGAAPMMQQEQKPRGLLGSLGIQKMEEGAEGETGQRFYNRDSFKDTAATLAQGFGRMGIMGMEEIADSVANQRTEAKARNKTLEMLGKMGTPQANSAIEYIKAGGAATDALKIAFAKPEDDRTAAMQNYGEYQRIFAEQGKEAADQFLAITRKGSVTNINTGDVSDGNYLYGAKAGLPAGFRLNIQTGEASAIPGGPADTAAKDTAAADVGLGTKATAGSTVLGDITEMKRRVKESPTLTTGFIGGILKNYGGTGALDVNELGKTIRANIGFDRLQRMRDESPTGGALGQVAVQELEALQASLGSLNTSQGAPQLIRNLERLEDQYRKSMRRILDTEGGARYFNQGEVDVIFGSPQGSSSQPTVINGYKIEKVDGQ
jgi:hypothetical protein